MTKLKGSSKLAERVLTSLRQVLGINEEFDPSLCAVCQKKAKEEGQDICGDQECQAAAADAAKHTSTPSIGANNYHKTHNTEL